MEDMLKSCENKVAVVTDAGSGIGRELALQLAVSGASIAPCDIHEPGLEGTSSLLKTGQDR